MDHGVRGGKTLDQFLTLFGGEFLERLSDDPQLGEDLFVDSRLVLEDRVGGSIEFGQLDDSE